MVRRLLPAAALVLVLGAPLAARAQSPEAVKHFDAGKKLRDEGKCREAVPEFEKSLAAEESVGAYYNLGFCFEELNRKQEAYRAYKLARVKAEQRKDDRYKEISGAMAAMEANNDFVRLVLPQPLPEGIEIRVNGELVPATFYEAETFVFTKTPPPHDVVVSAPGFEDKQLRVTSKQPVPVALQRPGEAAPPPPPPPLPPDSGGGWVWQQYAGAGLVAAGLGLAGLGVYLTFDHIDKKDTIERDFRQTDQDFRCAEGDVACKNAENDALAPLREQFEDEKARARLVLTATYGGAAVLLAGGVLLFLSAPPPRDPNPAPTNELRVRVVPQIGRSLTGLSLVGTF